MIKLNNCKPVECDDEEQFCIRDIVALVITDDGEEFFALLSETTQLDNSAITLFRNTNSNPITFIVPDKMSLSGLTDLLDREYLGSSVITDIIRDDNDFNITIDYLFKQKINK